MTAIPTLPPEALDKMTQIQVQQAEIAQIVAAAAVQPIKILPSPQP